MAEYKLVVAAALSETKSKFALAEALATEIPPRDAGQAATADGEDAVREYLEAARQQVIDAGGEPRSVNTLQQYRTTALWVKGGGTATFRWVDGMSFTAHNEARRTGMTYDEFAANPKTSRETRQDHEGASKDGDPERVVAGWSKEQRRAAVERIIEQSPVLDRAELVKKAVRGKDKDETRKIAREVIRDPDADLAFNQATVDSWNEIEETKDERQRDTERMRMEMDTYQYARRLRDAAQMLLRHLQQLEAVHQEERVTRALRQTRTALDYIDTAYSQGSASVSQEAERFLEKLSEE